MGDLVGPTVGPVVGTNDGDVDGLVVGAVVGSTDGRADGAYLVLFLTVVLPKYLSMSSSSSSTSSSTACFFLRSTLPFLLFPPRILSDGTVLEVVLSFFLWRTSWLLVLFLVFRLVDQLPLVSLCLCL